MTVVSPTRQLTDNQHIGNVTLYINVHHNTACFGYLIGEKEYWGKGAAIEAIRLLLDCAFNELKIRRVWGGAYLKNVKSIFNLKRLGFTQKGRLRKHQVDRNEYCDTLLFGMLREEWLTNRA